MLVFNLLINNNYNIILLFYFNNINNENNFFNTFRLILENILLYTLYLPTIFIFIFRLLYNVAICTVIIIVTSVISGESLICDTCVCKNSIINCTESGSIDVLDLWDHSNILENATLIYFENNGIVNVKQLPPSKVKYLSLRHNEINKIDKLAFGNLWLLVELDLSYNRLITESLSFNVFKVGIYCLIYLIIITILIIRKYKIYYYYM